MRRQQTPQSAPRTHYFFAGEDSPIGRAGARENSHEIAAFTVDSWAGLPFAVEPRT
jgi:hypothetical protein